MPATDPPVGVTIGEVWRIVNRVESAVETLAKTFAEMPQQIATQIEARQLERHTGLTGRVDRHDEQINGTRDSAGLVTQVARLTDLVGILRVIVFGQVALILTAFLTAIVALVLHR